MPRARFSSVLYFATLACLVPSAVIAAPTGQADVCHRLPSGAFQLIAVSVNALSAHLVHGDRALMTFFRDADGDGTGDPSSSTQACVAPVAYVANDADCDDTNAAIGPAATEVCNGRDDNCDGATDQADAVDTSMWFADLDADGFGDAATGELACDAPPGTVADDSDCDDDAAAVNPAAEESCNAGVDDDCDGLVDEPGASGAGTWYADEDGDGFGDAFAAIVACDPPTGHLGDATDCDDGDAAVSPAAAEVCNAYDDDCDGEADEPEAVDAVAWYNDGDGDGFGDPAVAQTACDAPPDYVRDYTDCDDGIDTVNPASVEVCDGLDDDCDGVADEPDAVGAESWFADNDGDGFGDPASAATACDQPFGYVADTTDCDDTDAAVHPDATGFCRTLPPECDEGDVTFVDAGSGTVTDLSSTFALGGPGSPITYRFTTNGTLRLCPGTWYTRVVIGANNGSIAGYGGRESVVLSGEYEGQVVEMDGNVAGTISGVTITRGDAYAGYLADGSYPYGGGVLALGNARITMSDCIVTGNRAVYGGGIAALIGSPAITMTDCELTNNEALSSSRGWGGGAYYTGGAKITLLRTNVEGNVARNGGGAFGDGSTGGLFLQDSTVRGNTATPLNGIPFDGYGGAIFSYDGPVVLTNVVVTENTAEAGGAIYGHAVGNFVLTDTTITDNYASAYGGAFALRKGNVELICTAGGDAGVWGNAAGSVGGGAWLYGDGTLTSESCDWDGGGTNLPTDIYLTPDGAASQVYNFGDNATFECTTSGGCN